MSNIESKKDLFGFSVKSAAAIGKAAGAPGYRPSKQPENCGNCTYRTAPQAGGKQGCSEFKFDCDPSYICDKWTSELT